MTFYWLGDGATPVMAVRLPTGSVVFVSASHNTASFTTATQGDEVGPASGPPPGTTPWYTTYGNVSVAWQNFPFSKIITIGDLMLRESVKTPVVGVLDLEMNLTPGQPVALWSTANRGWRTARVLQAFEPETLFEGYLAEPGDSNSPVFSVDSNGKPNGFIGVIRARATSYGSQIFEGFVCDRVPITITPSPVVPPPAVLPPVVVPPVNTDTPVITGLCPVCPGFVAGLDDKGRVWILNASDRVFRPATFS